MAHTRNFSAIREAIEAHLEQQSQWHSQWKQENLRFAEQLQQQRLKQQYDSQTKKEKGPQIGVTSKLPTQLEAPIKSKKTRSYALISSDEIFEKWEKGLCELCDELYVPGHKCKKVSSDYVIIVVDEEEDLRQPDFGVENPPSMDASQVFDESPKSNPNISSHGWVGEGQGKSPLGSYNAIGERLEGLNPSNGLLEKSLSSIRDKNLNLCEQEVSKDDCCDQHHPLADAFQVFEESPEVTSGLCVQEGVSEGGQMDDGNSQVHVSEYADLQSSFQAVKSEMCKNEEPIVPVENLKAFAIGLKVVCGKKDAADTEQEEVPVNPQMQDEHSQLNGSHNCQGINLALGCLMLFFRGGKKCWCHGWKEANDFCLFVFDPGNLVVEQGIPQPKPSAFLCARLVEILATSKLSIVRLVFDPGEEISVDHGVPDDGVVVAPSLAQNILGVGPLIVSLGIIPAMDKSLKQASVAAAIKFPSALFGMFCTFSILIVLDVEVPPAAEDLFEVVDRMAKLVVSELSKEQSNLPQAAASNGKGSQARRSRAKAKVQTRATTEEQSKKIDSKLGESSSQPSVLDAKSDETTPTVESSGLAPGSSTAHSSNELQDKVSNIAALDAGTGDASSNVVMTHEISQEVEIPTVIIELKDSADSVQPGKEKAHSVLDDVLSPVTIDGKKSKPLDSTAEAIPNVTKRGSDKEHTSLNKGQEQLEEAQGLLKSTNSSGHSKEARLARVCTGLSFHLQEYKSANDQLEELLAAERELSKSYEDQIKQLLLELAAATKEMTRVDSSMVETLAAKKSVIETLVSSLDNLKKQVALSEGSMASLQANLETLMINRKLTETIATEDPRRDGGEVIHHIDANVEYCSVIKTKQGAYPILMAAEMGCCNFTNDGRRFYVVFDPGGIIFLLTWLLLHTIHNLKAEGAVFDPGRTVALRMSIAASSWSGAGSLQTSLQHTLILSLEDKALEEGALMQGFLIFHFSFSVIIYSVAI